MFLFKYDSYPLILFLNVFAQVSITESSENKFVKCVSFCRHDTLTLAIILKRVPTHLKFQELEHTTLVFNENHLSRRNGTDLVLKNVYITNPPDESLLSVNFYDGYARVKIPLVKFILEKNDIVNNYYNCSSFCKLEFDVWDFLQSDPEYTKWNEAIFLTNLQNRRSFRQILHSTQNIKMLDWELVTIEAVLMNIPPQTQYVALVFDSSNVSIETKVVMNHSETHFNKFNFTLIPSYENHTKILIRLYGEEDVTLFEDKELVGLIRYTKKEKQKADVCFDECSIVYDFNHGPKGSQYIQTDFTLAVPSEVCAAHYNSTSERPYGSTKTPTVLSTTTFKTTEEEIRITTAETKTKGTEEATIKSTVGTTMKTIEEITTTTTAVATTKTTARITTDIVSSNNLAISLPSVAAVLLILLTVGIVLYRRHKVPKPVNDDTYLYATQLNYAQLELQSSELYEAPQSDYISSYTRVIGVLKPTLAERKERVIKNGTDSLGK